MEYEVIVETVEPRPMAAVRRRADPGQLSRVIPEGCGVVWDFIKKSGISHLGINVCVYFDGAINLECGVLVDGPFTPSGEIIPSATPGALVARTTHFGPYHRLGDAHGAIRDWSISQKYKLTGPSWEVYGHWSEDESKLRTDIFYCLDLSTGDSLKSS